ncbi:c-type cytochrome [Tahibacter soli]|jgi:cytochrome c553|uniref:Cytochrome c n=1 Tax=Tahibacter soli TaxID=2983605 RepID=A0A9X4BLD1_9GAMM|nr:cytochrome c [Tahibacter soli]MDC8015207.1 cytochrome c [Tahibacter soli]
MNRTFSLIAFGALAALSSIATAATVEDRVKPCAACHGAQGVPTDPQYAKLAGQYRDYLEQALKEYKSGKRKNPIMTGFATPLSDQDIKDFAAYFAGLPSDLSDLDHHVQGR